ncbi:hypothetical protein IFM89_034674 [Coptis chinensis]|uniref:AAA+ ATPase domain-containing protein n=1 Tax=Coptis chinensis TaxID=261450 RepID=A0A835LQ58_9MAGN|nr:hypothetical protein IFM89_034674 [Coptis chinensis]
MEPVTGEVAKSFITHGEPQNNNHLIRNTVETWLRQADRLFEEATQLNSEAGHINSWWEGWFSCSRFSLGRQAAKKIVDIQQLLVERSKFGDIVSDPKRAQSFGHEPVVDFETFASREASKSEVIAAVTTDENSLVGIYGMPGVGKTVLMKEIMAQLKEEKLFDEFVMVVVSQNPSLIKIQDAIAQRLDLKFEVGDEDVSIRAAKLSKRLKQGKKTLLLLDDVWEPMDFIKVGIPYKNVGNRCKVIFTTRIQEVCERMKMDKKIEVRVLSEVDSWNLFRKDSEITTDVLFGYMMGEKLIRDVDTFRGSKE